MTVLDASAVLALLRDEPGAGAVEDAIDEGAIIGAVNLSEVLVKMASVGAAPDRALELIGGLFVEVVSYGPDAARDGALMWSTAPGPGLSLGDRACLSLARIRRRPVLTADRAWVDLAVPLGIEVRSIR